MKVQRNSKINKYRNHNSAVNRMTSINSSSAVTPVDPVDPITNDPSLLSYNSLMASDEFYDKLDMLREEYKRFYHDQQELEKALKNMKQQDELLSEKMKILVEKYNTALSSLKKFDRQFNTDHRKNIEELLKDFEDNLVEIGVTITDNAILEFNEEEFKKSLLKSNNAIKFLFRPIRGLIMRLHRAFRNINIPEEEYEYYDESNLNHNYHGMITDEKI